MSFVEAEHAGAPVVVCRTGYTGERGYELVCDNDAAAALWDALLAAGEPYGMLPCGLGARDTLRTEMGYPLHGQDISLDVTPEPGPARLGGRLEEGRVLGQGRAARREGGGPGARAARPGRHRPRHPAARACGCCSPADVPVGEVTSGTFSPTLRKGVGLALVASQVADGRRGVGRRPRAARGVHRDPAAVRDDRRPGVLSRRGA